MNESKQSKVIFTHKKIKQFRRWCFCSYNKPFGLFSLFLRLKKSIFRNLESMTSTYAKICWIVARNFSTLFPISEKKTFFGHRLLSPVYKNVIKSPYEVITLTFHLLFNGIFSWSKSYNSCKRMLFKTNTFLWYYPLPLAFIFLKWTEVKIISNIV